MNHMIQRCAPGLLAVLVAAGGGVAVTTIAHAQATAATPGAQAAPPPHPPMEPHGPGMHGHPMMRELERLKTSLKLDASQTALWDRAQARMRPPTDPRDGMKARRERIAAMLDDPNFDPRKLAADMDGADTERRAQMSAMRDAWFAVYDSLNPVQRGQVREFLRSHMGRPHGRGGGEHDGWMHQRDGGPGREMAPR